MELPDELVARPLRPQDAPAVAELMAASQLLDVGQAVIDEADIVSDWSQPSFDVPARVVGVYDGDALVAYAEYSGADRGDGAVHPAYRDRGIGTHLCGWLRRTASAHGAATVGTTVPQGSAGERLLRDLGYELRWESWVFELPPGAEIEQRPPPEGYHLREATASEYQDVCDVIEDAFLEWSVRPRRRFEDWVAVVPGRPGFEPWNLVVATGPDGEVVGAVYAFLSQGNGYVEMLAVHRNHRNKGLARALLADAFARARDHGGLRSELSTDSRTGARSLYEGLGMRVTSTWVSYATPL